MADITAKDYWVVVTGRDYIKVTETAAEDIRQAIGDGIVWIDLVDIFNSASWLKLSTVTQLYHINEEILRAAKAHRDWAEGVE